MNHSQSWDVHQSHMSAGPTHAPLPVTSSGMSQYSHYQQPPLLQPGPSNYSSGGPYGQYGYSNGITSPQSAGHPVSAPMSSQMNSHLLPLPAMTQNVQLPTSQGPISGTQYSQSQSMDTTGQIAPAGMKPRVTATLWEDEGSLCFQVEAKGVCVARREDNHMINGTKLLNVAGMTRGRRDGILKSEKMRHVVKIGPMHLKGVWIPFDRALDFANKEKITELLYPLFVHNIGALLYHPTNQTRTGAVMAAQAAERRRHENGQIRNPQTTAPSQPLHHHHSMQNNVGTQLPGPPLGSNPANGRPGLDRAHTFPTPPTSASSIMGMGSSDASFQWNGQSMGAVQSNQSLGIGAGLSNAHSEPATPATTPPGNTVPTMQPYQSAPAYDHGRPMYSAPPTQQGQYASQPTVTQQNMARFGQPMQPSQYVKNEMGPPSSRAPGVDDNHGDSKPNDHLLSHSQGNGQVGHGTGEEVVDHEHENEYTHENNAAYSSNRGPAYYGAAPAVGGLSGEHPHLSPDMSGSPHHTGSGRATPRTAAAPNSTWGAVQQNSGYNTPPRAQTSASSLYNVMGGSDSRGPTTNSVSNDAYPSSNGLTGYSSQPIVNGSSSNKRLRDVDDDGDRGSRPGSRGTLDEIDSIKRRKTFREGSLPGVAIGGPIGSTFDAGRQPITQRRR